MAREDAEFCKMETTFILHDPRFKSLPLGARAIYITLWAEAVTQRSEVIMLRPDVTAYSREANVRSNDMARALAVLNDPKFHLIEIIDETHIRVCGVKSKHPKLKWEDNQKSETCISPYLPVSPDIGQTREEKRREEKSTPLPPEGGAQTQTLFRVEKDKFYERWNALAVRKIVKPFHPPITTKTWQNVEKLLDKFLATPYFRENQDRLFSMLPDANWLATVWIPRLEQFLGNNEEHIPHYEIVLNEGYRDEVPQAGKPSSPIEVYQAEYDAEVKKWSPYGLPSTVKQGLAKRKKELGLEQ